MAFGINGGVGSPLKPNEETSIKFWQPVLVYKQPIVVKTKKRFKRYEKSVVMIPIKSSKIFADKESAGLYLSIYLRELIADGYLPQESIIDNQVNTNLVDTLVQEVVVAELVQK